MGITENKMTKAVMSIIRTADVVNNFLEFELRKSGSSPARFSVMNALIVHGGKMSPTNISKWVFRAKHSVTVMLRVLEEIGYVRREPHGEDRRSVNIIVTKKGWEATRMMIHNSEKMGQKILSCLDEQEIENLAGLLKQIRKHLFSDLKVGQNLKNTTKQKRIKKPFY